MKVKFEFFFGLEILKLLGMCVYSVRDLECLFSDREMVLEVSGTSAFVVKAH